MEEQNHSETPPPVHKPLFRVTRNQMIGGVCAGIADYFDVDPTIVRVVFVLFTFLQGVGILIYILLWIVLPVENSEPLSTQKRVEIAVSEMKEKAQSALDSLGRHTSGENANPGAQRDTFVFAWILIIIGAMFLLRDFGPAFGFSSYLTFGELWPVILVIVGVALLYKKR